MNGENNKESSAEVTDVDSVRKEQELAAQEQGGQTEGGSEQAAMGQGQEMRKSCCLLQTWRRGSEGPAQGGGVNWCNVKVHSTCCLTVWTKVFVCVVCMLREFLTFQCFPQVGLDSRTSKWVVSGLGDVRWSTVGPLRAIHRTPPGVAKSHLKILVYTVYTGIYSYI